MFEELPEKRQSVAGKYVVVADASPVRVIMLDSLLYNPIPSIPNTADITGWLRGAHFIARPLNADVRARNVWQRPSRDTANQP